MSMFITAADRVPIGVDGEVSPAAITDDLDIIWIYPVMPLGIEQKVNGRALRIEQLRNQRTRKGDPAVTMRQAVDVGAWDAAMLELNILHWQGPSFTDPRTGRAVPCTPANIAQLNPQEPIVRAVRAELTRRNQRAEDAPEAPDEAPGDDDGEGADPNA